MSGEKGKIESLSHENRVFAPREAMKKGAAIPSMIDYLKMQSQAEANLEDFWSVQASEHLKWKKTWTKVLDWKPPRAKWFVGGEINVSENCLDRHLGTPRENKPAIIWVGEPEGEKLTLTYKELHARVCKFANGLKKLGVHKGDRVALYMPMTPEAAIGMLACARIGAIHSVVFGGFSSESLKDRIHDAEVKFVLTADGAWRGGKVIPLKATVDAALVEGTPVQKVVVLKRTKSEVSMKTGRDFWWSEVETNESADCPPEALESEHPLFILYTSGTTGKPKGIWHSSAGYLLGATLTSRWVFDLREEDIFWCTADVGWITGHSYVVYGPLSNGATTVMYEGGPMYPNPDRFWSIIDELKVTTFYTAPTAIRAFMKQGDEWVAKHKLNSLRILGTVGEPINPEAWMWYHKKIGHEKCPIVDTWWQTETGSIMLSPLPAATPTKPGSATFPLPGIFPRIVDENGKTVEAGGGGYLVIDKPWPSMLRGVWGDEERFKKTYFEKFPGIYFTGDGAQQDKDGYFWIMGRVDDVINVSGHRLGTAEIESALVSHQAVAEAAVVGIPHEVKGTGVVAFVTLKGGQTASDSLNEELRAHVAKEIGAIAKPERIQFTDKLPKTRSGKIMRRLLRELAAGKEVKGDVTTLEDTDVLESLRQN